MKFWIIMKEKYKENNEYEIYKEEFLLIDKLIDMTENALWDTPKLIFKKNINKLKNNIVSIKRNTDNEDIINLFERMVAIIENRVSKKWEENLINLLTKLRKEKGYSQSKLAREANISNAYISKYENKESTNLSISKLYNIAKALEVEIPWLFSQVLENEAYSENYEKSVQQQSKKLDSLITNSYIVDENNKFYSSEEKEKLVKYIKKINLIKYDKEITFETTIKLVDAFKGYKGN